MKEILVNRVPRVHFVSFLHKCNVVRATHMNPNKSKILLPMFLLQRGEIVLDNCHRLLCKQALPDVTQLSNVLHHEGRVIAIYQQIWVLIRVVESYIIESYIIKTVTKSVFKSLTRASALGMSDPFMDEVLCPCFNFSWL